MNTCRRIINAFADAVYPPREEKLRLDGTEYDLGKEKYLTRIYVLLREKCTSESRRQRLNKTLREVHERVSAGVHSDVTLEEAKTLFLQTYLTIGEIILCTQGTTVDDGSPPS